MKPDPRWGPANKADRIGKYAIDSAMEMERYDTSDIKGDNRLEGIDNLAASTATVNMTESSGDAGAIHSYKL